MPAYDYRCPDCGFVDEVVHSMSESPEYQCPDCKVKMNRVFNSFNLGHGNGRMASVRKDAMARDNDMKQEMREDHGVENIVPLRPGGVKGVYEDLKAQGSFVRDNMQAQEEMRAAKKRQEKKEWMERALKRADKRGREKKEKKLAEASKKRAIRL